MLTPEDIEELRPKFEQIHQLLSVALIESKAGISDDAYGGFILAIALMEELAAEVAEKQGHSVKEALERVTGATDEEGQGINLAEGAGVLGAAGGAAASLSFTGLGGFGVVGGGSAIGLGGLAGAGVATGGMALAGAAAAYLAYKGGAAVWRANWSRKAADQAEAAGRKAADQAEATGRKAADQAGAAGRKAAEQAGATGRKAAEQAGAAGRKAAEQAGATGRKAAEQAGAAGRKAAEQAGAARKKAAGGLGKLRNVRKRSDSQKGEPPGALPSADG